MKWHCVQTLLKRTIRKGQERLKSIFAELSGDLEIKTRIGGCLPSALSALEITSSCVT